jgi:hypothetical protein
LPVPPGDGLTQAALAAHVGVVGVAGLQAVDGAWTMGVGVSKSGSPTDSSSTSRPCSSMARAR